MTDGSVLRRCLPTRLESVDALAVAVVLGGSLWAFRSAYGGVAFGVIAVVGMLFAMSWAHLADRLRVPLVVAVLGAAVLYLVLATALVVPHDGLAGFVPTPDSARTASEVMVRGWKDLVTTAPPVGDTGALLALPLFMGVAGGFGAVAVLRRLRSRPLATAPAAIALGIAIAVGTRTPTSVLVHGAILALLAICWWAWGAEAEGIESLSGGAVDPQRIALTIVVLLIAAVGGLRYSDRVPLADVEDREIWRDAVTPPFDPRRYPSPLAGYRFYVKPGYDVDGEPLEPKPMFTIEGLPPGVPIRLATMDRYDGLTWQVSGGDPGNPSLRNSGSFERVGVEVLPDHEGELVTIVVTVHDYADVWVPSVGEVVSLRFTGSAEGGDRDRELRAAFRYNRATDTAASNLRLRSGDRYEMVVRLPALVDDLAGRVLPSDYQPLGTHDRIGEITDALATPDILDINDPGARADALRVVMIETGAYSDGDEQAEQLRAGAGHSASRLVDFAGDFPQVPFVGNAEQYSATYALLLRDVTRLPSRVVMGFLPEAGSVGEPITVVATDVDAWVEVLEQDRGWIATFPTPPRDQRSAAAVTSEQSEPDYRTRNPPAPPVVDPEFDQPAKASGEAESPPDPEAEEEAALRREEADRAASDEPLLSGGSAIAVVAVGSPVLALLLFVGVVATIKALRRRRRRRRGPGHERVANGWLEVPDLAVDLGRPVPTGLTRYETAGFVGGDHARALAAVTDEKVWSGRSIPDAEVDEYWDYVQRTKREVRASAGWRSRAASVASVQSLRRSRASLVAQGNGQEG